MAMLNNQRVINIVTWQDFTETWDLTVHLIQILGRLVILMNMIQEWMGFYGIKRGLYGSLVPSGLWLFNIAMENGPFLDDLWWFTDLPIKNCDFP